MRFHDLRHTFASPLTAEGAHAKVIMDRLGHSSITVTLNTFGHLLPSLDGELTDRLDATWRRARAGRVVPAPDPEPTHMLSRDPMSSPSRTCARGVRDRYIAECTQPR